MNEIIIDLASPPENRWFQEKGNASSILELSKYYLDDLESKDNPLNIIGKNLTDLIPQEYFLEAKGLAKCTKVLIQDILQLNLYYDFTKLILGCTAFASESKHGLFHARNLDWLSERRALSRYSRIAHFINGIHGKFSIVGWPGCIGALSGMAENRFSITLNAALSSEPQDEKGFPIAFLIRSVLEKEPDFDSAVETLRTTNLLCDCLLLVVGIKAGEAVVIERTPMRQALRWIKNGKLSVTNSFLALDIDDETLGDELTTTSCGRLKAIDSLLDKQLPRDEHECLSYLSDSKVIMKITEQQMVFNASKNALWCKSSN